MTSGIIGVFREGAQDLLDGWARTAGELAAANGRPEAVTEARDRILRTLTNLKGAADGVGLARFGEFMSQLEELVLSLSARGNRCLVQNADLLLAAQAAARDWIVRMGDDVGHTPDLSALHARIKSIGSDSHLGEWSQPATRNLGNLLVESGEATPEQVERAARLQSRRLGEVMVDEGMISKDTLQKTLASQQAKPVPGRSQGETIKVPAGRIDNLLRIIGELSIHQAIVWHSRQSGSLNSRNCQNAIALSHKIIREVQSQIMMLRLQPLRSLFQRLERSARDVALAQAKNVNTVVKGADTDLDKVVIEKVGDPFLHMIRNAVDHGIEPPEERVRLGKPETATIRMSASTDAGDVIVELSDDGRGMDPEKIFRKAVEKGLTRADAKLSREQILNFIFVPGFSTADTVTEFSGRGVGMDVVNRTLNDLGGTIQIHSEVGKGTTFTVTIPMTVSLMDAVVFTVDELRYVVPMRDLVEVIDLCDYPVEGNAERGGQVVDLRGSVVPLDSLRDYLPRPGRPADLVRTPEGADSRQTALVMKCEEGIIAFRVDRILGQQQIVVRTLNESLAKLPGYVGGTILGDGEPGMIVDLANIARGYFQRLKRSKERVA